MMGKVYANAFCNISATGARDGRDGCFLPREDIQLLYIPLVVCATWKGSKETGPPPGFYVGEVTSMWNREVADSPIGRRAWVFQERLLSHRVLHFGARQLLWDCCELTACEKHPNEFTRMLRSDHLGSRKFLSFHHSVVDAYLDENGQLLRDRDLGVYYGWESIVQTYARGGITKGTDRLIALAGLYCP